MGNNLVMQHSVSGNVSIGGTLTYEDVKNVDAVGLITARSGIRVTGGVIEAQAGENKIPSLYSNMGASSICWNLSWYVRSRSRNR